jgi:hypothetical protein
MPDNAPMPTGLDWKYLEQTLFQAYWSDAQAFLKDHPDQHVYAFALAEMYRELDGPIYLPVLAANSEEAYAELATDKDDHPDHLSHIRWNPPDWGWAFLGEDQRSPELTAAEQMLIAEASRSSEAHWKRTEAKLLKLLIKISKALMKAAKQSEWRTQLTTNFIVWLSLQDDAEGAEIARQCLGGACFTRLFTAHDAEAVERRRVAAMPADMQLRYHLACLQGLAQESLGLTRERATNLREEALDALSNLDNTAVAHALLPLLAQSNQQWRAAMVLAQLAFVDDRVIQALRTQVLKPAKNHMEESGRNWCASALAALGDSAWLLEQLDGKPGITPERIASGIAHPYRSWNSKPHATPLTLDYGPLEEALTHSSLHEALSKELSPGCGYCILRDSDIDAALRGLHSPHALVRTHAAAIMGERSLGAKAGKHLTAALAHTLRHDTDQGVRFQAMLSLHGWRKAGCIYQADIQHAALNDPHDVVREAATRWLQAFGEEREQTP